VVTGASAGIGEATAKALAAAGMSVVAAARRTDRLEALAAGDERIAARTVDVTSPDDVRSLARWMEERYGACHVLVNNAGASFGNTVRGPADLADFQRTMDLNLLGSVRCMTELSDLLFRSAPGRVINVASVAGKLGVGPPAYVASKFALVGFSEAVGTDWARKGVTVSQVNPGFIRTEQFPQDELMANAMTRRLVGTPEDVAGAIVEVARKGTPERTVPRWYRAGAVVRHTVAPAYRAAAKRSSF
jgi:NAD(P)-dependent dehydrogenase (short-subunit alcohol dehydrogenase family)